MTELTSEEAIDLLKMNKKRKDERSYLLPDERGGRLKIELESDDKREEFFLDITRGRIKLEKVTYQNRARQTSILARLDYGGPPHTNPDDKPVGVPHLHVYREGYGDKWAYALPSEHFSGTADRHKLLQEFMRYCNISEPPHFTKGLFS